MNRLSHAESLYLRKHAENPIDWWSWCDEALETAKQQSRPIFLSIGYSSCHWCTVMEGEAFSDPTIATYLNDHFLPIKVDREERPDLDSIYLQAAQLITGVRGWPLNLFLSPDNLLPFYAGTYFPIESKYGKPGFLAILQQILQVYETNPDQIASIEAEIFGLLQPADSAAGQELSKTLLRQGLTKNSEVLVSQGTGSSFPMIPYANAALRVSRFEPPNTPYGVAGICQQRGLDLVLGGIFDHVGGGFHRYTVDPTWTVPHFEKMLYDNGQIVEYLADLWSTGVNEPVIERAIEHTISWLKREMTAPQGYFYAAQDADSFVDTDAAESAEGAFYIWSYQELERHLTTAELQALSAQFTITPGGNFAGKNVLQRYQAGQLSLELEAAFSKLFVVRYGFLPTVISTVSPACNNQDVKTYSWKGRILPVTDTKMIVAWNSLMISGLARAATVFKSTEYLHLAITAAQFIWEHQLQADRFYRLNYNGKPTITAQSEDYALFIKALLDLDQASLSGGSDYQQWLSRAIVLQEEFDNYLWSVEFGGYYNSCASANLAWQERSSDDSSMPSANGVAIANLVRLFLLTENVAYLDRAEQALQCFSSIMIDNPQRCPSLFVALDWFRNQTRIQVAPDLIESLISGYLPTAVLKLKPDDNGVGLVCQGLSCQIPASTWEQLQSHVCESITRG
jgi:uncharacterized protein